MRKEVIMKRPLVPKCTVFLGLAVACGGAGSGGGGPTVQSFPLTLCDKQEDCSEGFTCSPVACADVCIPDGHGKCLPCNGGKVGQCLPKPATSCDQLTCGPDEECVLSCNGFCDSSKGKCEGVSCIAQCVPRPKSCQADADCGAGRHCEFYCLKGCTEPMPAMSGRAEKCPDMQCEGRCVDDPTPPKKCASDADCGEGFVCELVYCALFCAPDGKGGCVPCNDGSPGVCVPKPAEGCASDQDCAAGEVCQVVCAGWCDAFAGGSSSDPASACGEKCIGTCVPKQNCLGVDCGPGYECVEVCALCTEPVEYRAAGSGRPAPACGECLPQCVPIGPEPGPCDQDSDCPAGFHCEPVYCAMACLPDEKGGCLPCNEGHLGQCVQDPQKGCRSDQDCAEGEECHVYCMGLCDPNAGCGETCFGECVPKQAGCASDADCGEGFHCEVMCTAGCAPTSPAGGAGAGSRTPPCGDAGQCFGQCIPNPPPPRFCDSPKDCPEGFVCEPVFCAQPEYCVPDASDPSGCVPPPPCNEGHLGVCVPAPQVGCQQDGDCAQGERCEVVCTGLCDPTFGCADHCFGTCVPAQTCVEQCPDGYECVQVCPDCAPGMDCTGECVFACVPGTPEPQKCNEDKDCPAGFHCEPVMCILVCLDDGQGGCLPCNDGYLGQCERDSETGCQSDAECSEGEVCEVFCTGYCAPGTYCTDLCEGVCVKKPACSSDADCPQGFFCQMMCPKDCGPVPAFDPGRDETPKCVSEVCEGQCVPKPAPCEKDEDCPPGFSCEEQGVCPPCVYSDPACMMPCWTEKVCVPPPVAGCRSDADCQPWQFCAFACTMSCAAGSSNCAQSCEGQCTDRPD